MARPPRLPLPGRRRAINAELPAEGTERPPDGSGAEQAAPAEPGRDRSMRLWPAVLAAAVIAIAALGVLISTGVIGADREVGSGAPVPTGTETVPGGDESLAVAAAAELGFPSFATKNTTRVGGGDAATNAAAVALATFPTSGQGRRPAAVTLVTREQWPVALAAASLVAEPVSTPILLGAPDRIPDPTEKAMAAFDPPGGPVTGGAQVIAVGDVAMPPDLEAIEVVGETPAETAVEIARTRARLAGSPPGAYVVISDADPSFAMPAASWAARSGDPLLLVNRNDVPEATLELVRRTPDVPVFLLGPEEVATESVLESLQRASDRPVSRIEAPDPIESSITFARYSRGEFGWSINDPGHGLVIAHASRPLDAAAAAPLSASGTWAPLLITDRVPEPPDALRSYLLDIKPGYRDDPTRALYNHVWIIGNLETIGLGQQATIDQLAELERIGEPESEPPPVEPEVEQERRPRGEDDQEGES